MLVYCSKCTIPRDFPASLSFLQSDQYDLFAFGLLGRQYNLILAAIVLPQQATQSMYCDR